MIKIRRKYRDPGRRREYNTIVKKHSTTTKLTLAEESTQMAHKS